MSKLIKEEVIAQFTAAYLGKHGKAPTIEQKGSWYKVDDGKSVRLADLAQLANELATHASSKQTGDTSISTPKSVAAKKKPNVKSTTNGGLTPSQLWSKKIGTSGKLPRGL